jgi:hypothetical protein
VQNDPHTPTVARMAAAEHLLGLLADIPANMHVAYLRGELERVIRIGGFTDPMSLGHRAMIIVAGDNAREQ